MSEILFHESKSLFTYFNKYIPQLDFRWADGIHSDSGTNGNSAVVGGELWKSSQEPMEIVFKK